MNQKNIGNESMRVSAWFRQHKSQIELLQRISPQSQTVRLLERIIQYHNQTGVWPTLKAESWQLLRRVFKDMPPFNMVR